MNTLPNEILSSILTNLPQRYAIDIGTTVCKKWHQVINQSSIYSTIHIYSKQQLTKLLQKIKEDKDNTIRYNIKHLVFHYRYLSKDEQAASLLTFPHLQSIHGLLDKSNIHDSAHYNQPLYVQLHPLTSFIYYEHGEQWIIKFNNIKKELTSLRIYITSELFDSIPEQHEKMDSIYIKTIGIKKVMGPETELDSDATVTPFPIKMLILSTTSSSLIHLTELYINFYSNENPNFIIDENTFENIHQLCPFLESLSIEDVYINIFDPEDRNNEYYIPNDKKPYQPIHTLKKIEFIKVIFDDERCFSYIAEKYPKLEYFAMDLWFQNIHPKKIPSFKEAIYNMFHHFHLLKRISLISFPNTGGGPNWIHFQFMKWLYEHPHQITHLDYDYDLVLDTPLKKYLLNSNNNIFNIENSLNDLQLQIRPPFLNHLTTLSIPLKSIVQLALSYFLQSPNSMILSNVLEHLNITGFFNVGINKTHIYDWLDIFPNLISLKMKKINNIMDNNTYGEDEDDFDMYNNQPTNKLHKLIQQKKKIIHSHKSYPLKQLEIKDCRLWFKNGFDELLKECHHLKQLQLRNIAFVIYTKPSSNEFHLDLSHLHLELLYIDNINQMVCDLLGNAFVKHRFTLMETVNNYKRVISGYKNNDDKDPTIFNLILTCKYVDQFVYNSF